MPEGVQMAADLLAEGILLERLALYDRALERYRVAATSADPATRAEALRHESCVYRSRCQWDLAIEAARESAYIAESYNLTDLFTEALNAEGLVWLARGETERAPPLFKRMLELTRSDRLRGIALQNLGTAAAMRRLFDEAEAYFAESHECFRRAGYPRGIAVALNNCGRFQLDRGRPDLALERFGSAMAAAQGIDDIDLVALVTLNTAECYALADDCRRAEELAATALGYFTVAGNHWRRIECLRLFGDIRMRQKDRATAERAYRHGLELARTTGARAEERDLAARLESFFDPAN
jgi:tetratricopeptide (TPR) repeat protein